MIEENNIIFNEWSLLNGELKDELIEEAFNNSKKKNIHNWWDALPEEIRFNYIEKYLEVDNLFEEEE